MKAKLDPELAVGDEVRGSNGSTAAGPELPYRRASEIEMVPVKWAWADLIPLGLISVLAGPPGLGKTTFAVDLAAHVTRGDLPGDIDEPACALYVSAEDVGSVLTSRLVAAGGDRGRFVVMDADAGLKLPDHAAALADIAVREGAKLIVIDPWSAFSTGDSHVEAEVRQVMAPMHAALAEREIAALLVMHLNKSNAADLVRRVSGSVAHTAAPRSALLWARDPSDSERGPLRVLAHGKCNVGPEQPSQAWRVTTERIEGDSGEPMEVGRVHQAGESDASISDLLRGGFREAAPERDAARAFLLRHLAEGPVRSSEVYDAAEGEGIARRTLQRAKEDLRNEDSPALIVKQKHDGWYCALTNVMPEGF